MGIQTRSKAAAKKAASQSPTSTAARRKTSSEKVLSPSPLTPPRGGRSRKKSTMEAAEEPAQPPAKPSATHAPVTPARYVDPPGGYLANTRTPSQQLEDELIASLTPRRSNGRGKRRAASQSSGPRKRPTPTRPTKDASTSVSPGFLCQFPNAQDSPEARDRQSTPDGAGSAARDDDGDLAETQLALAREMERSADLEQQL